MHSPLWSWVCTWLADRGFERPHTRCRRKSLRHQPPPCVCSLPQHITERLGTSVPSSSLNHVELISLGDQLDIPLRHLQICIPSEVRLGELVAGVKLLEVEPHLPEVPTYISKETYASQQIYIMVIAIVFEVIPDILCVSVCLCRCSSC